MGKAGANVRIAIDAMGGDNAPAEVVKGACLAAQEYGVDILLVGDAAQIAPILNELPHQHVEILHASDQIAMGAHPLEAVRKQKDSSLVVAANAVKQGQAQALISAGSTGAAMAASFLSWGRIKGVERPAIGTVLPTLTGPCVMVDSGAQVDAKPKQLISFAAMGSVYAAQVLGVSNPRVGLLNVGVEETKGSHLTLEVYPLLKEDPRINFVGNVEGRDILSGVVDVLVCDGFVGNVVLKSIEGVAGTLFHMLKDALTSSLRAKAGALLVKDALGALKKRFDYTEYGGAPLLGVNGVCIISHGSSDAKAIKNAIRVAHDAVKHQVVERILTTMSIDS
jgi:glycerol-3-phosphate acyltransferase PlsX